MLHVNLKLSNEMLNKTNEMLYKTNKYMHKIKSTRIADPVTPARLRHVCQGMFNTT